ncbi:integrase [Saccharothrix tamanrassetensis]|uniref:Integrase n=1 Tax=Saccharothrix tamanrassetensis TaxID=1051531 RepID=A0A841CTK9_9PSEU|nr:tyrosine-type recombinase/integrase [Saccharothrix tamanrassetensis]MBB5960639.1 integrase [Saccharothrix tamanrassetensis]
MKLYVRWMQEVRRFKPSTVSRRMAVVSGFYRTCAIASVLDHSPADFALVAMLGLLGLRVSEAGRGDVQDLGEEHGHRVLLVHGKGGKETLVPLPPAVGRAIERAVDDRTTGPILLNRRARRMDRHCATSRLHHLAKTAVVRLPELHPHLVRHTCVTTMLDAGVDLRDVQIAARHADPRTTRPRTKRSVGRTAFSAPRRGRPASGSQSAAGAFRRCLQIDQVAEHEVVGAGVFTDQ